MKILYLAPEMVLPGTHGGSSHVEGSVQGLLDLGHEVTVILKKGENQRFKERINKLTYLRFPTLPSGIGKLISYTLTTTLSSALLKYDIIFERARVFGGIGTLISRIKGKRSVYEMNEPLPEILKIENKFSEKTYKLIEKMHYFILKNSSITIGTHKSFFRNYKGNNIMVVSWGINTKKFEKINYKKNNSKKTILYVGSFTEWHALEETIEAIKEVIKKENNIQLIMIGTGKQFSKIKEIIEKNKLEQFIKLIGKKPFTEIPKYIIESEVCLCLFNRNYPPFKEFDYFYSPIKVHEYKISGKPIVASNIGNLKNLVIDNKGGILVNEQNPKEIADAILKILNSKDMGKFNKEDAKKYDWAVLNKKILENIRN